MAFRTIRVDVDAALATITFDRPAVRNALNLETVNECHQALTELAADRSIGALIVTGAGDAAFVAGADINDMRARTRDDGLAAINSTLFSAFERFPRPTAPASRRTTSGSASSTARTTRSRAIRQPIPVRSGWSRPVKGGKTMVTGTIDFSADSSTRTLTTETTDASGKKVSSVNVYQRQ